ncbi:penicillin-binding protein 1C [Myxococcota bacterium]|nr:penicillin-binding protein 1C [Myxococcota bacterium]
MAWTLVVALACAAGLVLWVRAEPFPVDRLRPEAFESTRIRDRHGRVLREALSDDAGRARAVPLEGGVSPWVPQAFLAIEDHRFRDHFGLDLRGIARATRDNLLAGRVVAGGSTLSQQLAGLVFPGPRTFANKAREAVWALRLERALSKEAILEAYVNRAPFGHGAIGIEAAARLYFEKPAVGLTLAESALLAGVPRAPTLNNPFSHPDRAVARMRQVLDRMQALGLVDAERHAQALAEPLRFARRDRSFAAPHFTTWVLTQTPGPGDVVTTLDAALQAEVEAAIEEVLPTLADRRVGQAAVVVLDNPTGDILAWVGSRDFFGDDGQVDMVRGERQPGSTLKPFLYGLALEQGETAATRLPDFPMFFETLSGDYRPQNYDRRFHGWVSLREALACSYNVPAVHLANEIGVGALYERLHRLGFDSLRRAPSHYGLGLALGNGEVTLLELANAYRTLANEGEHRPVRWRTAVPSPAGERVMPAAVARLVTDILSDPIARAPAFGRHNALELPFPAAAKTGTSTDFTDNWTVGYTPAVTVAVWVGNFDGRPMEGVSGITGAGRLWHRVMRRLGARAPGGAFSRRGLVEASLCAEAFSPVGRCEHTIVERFLPGTAPLRDATGGGAPATDTGGPTGVAGTPLRVAYPDDGDVFGLSPDVPGDFSRVAFRAERADRLPLGAAEQSLVWEIDGIVGPAAPKGPFFWPATPGRHRVRVWPAASPERASPAVVFEVLAAAPSDSP